MLSIIDHQFIMMLHTHTHMQERTSDEPRVSVRCAMSASFNVTSQAPKHRDVGMVAHETLRVITHKS
jgi:hypothetical protein